MISIFIGGEIEKRRKNGSRVSFYPISVNIELLAIKLVACRIAVKSVTYTAVILFDLSCSSDGAAVANFYDT